MSQRVREIAELPQPRPDILGKTGKNLHYAVLTDVNRYRNYAYHTSCLSRALVSIKNSL